MSPLEHVGQVTPSPPPAPAEFQQGIYMRGLGGDLPAVPVAFEDLEAAASRMMEPSAFDYVAGGAGSEDTMRANLEAFRGQRVVPRMLRDVSRRDIGVTLFGQALPTPLLLSPLGVQGIIHPEAEEATARGAAAAGVPYILSTAASRTLEQVAAAAEAVRWFQLYWPRNRDIAQSLVHRAEAAGYSALVVTLDTWLLGWRPRDLQGAYLPFLRGEGLANYLSDPAFRSLLESPPEENPTAAILTWATQFSDPAINWDDLAWLRDQTRLPVILKGIQHPDDAVRAVREGADAVFVSNHGGRQVDGAVASLHALTAVRAAVGKDYPLLFDSGVRTGADIFKALALGADAVSIGRPYAYGLALAGAAGVEHVVRCLLAEFDLTMALAGQSDIRALGPELLQAG